MSIVRSVLVPVVVTLLLAGACGDDGGSTSATLGDLAGKTFVSTSVEGHPMDGTHVTLSFDDDDGVAVRAECNTLRGAVTIDAGRLEVGPMVQTMIGCPDELAAQDAFLNGFFESGPHLTMSGRTLTLTADEATITAEQQE